MCINYDFYVTLSPIHTLNVDVKQNNIIIVISKETFAFANIARAIINLREGSDIWN